MPPVPRGSARSSHARAVPPRVVLPRAVLRAGLAPAALLLVALVLRLAYVFEIGGDPLYRHAGLDEELYFRDALALLAGEPPDLPFWRPPGVTWALAGTLGLFGPGAAAPRIVIALLSTLTCGLLYLLARRYLPRGAALVALALVAINAPLIHMASEIKDTAWVTALDLLGLLLLVDAERRARAAPAFGAGLVFGLSALFRPLILVFIPAAALVLLVRRGTSGGGRRAALLLAGAALALAPVVALNNARGGPFVLVCTNGGMNLFIGNNPDYLRTVTARPGSQWNDVVLRPALAAGHAGADRDQEAFFQRAALAFIRDEPLRAAGLYLRKLALFLNGHEIPRDTDLELDARAFATLRPFTWRGPIPFPMGVLLPLALVGMTLGARRVRGLGLPILFVALQAAAVAAYFVTSRYRIPAIPVIALLSVIGASELLRAGRTLPIAARAGGLIALIAVSLALCRPTAETRQSLRAERLFMEGNALRLEGRPAEAIRRYEEAARLDPKDTRPLLVLGEMHAAAGDLAAAISVWRRVVADGGYSARDRDRLVSLLLRAGRREEALLALGDDLAGMPPLPERRAELHFRRGVLEAELTRFRAALASFDSALSLAPALARESLERWIERAAPEATEVSAGETAAAPDPFWPALRGRISTAGYDPPQGIAARPERVEGPGPR